MNFNQLANTIVTENITPTIVASEEMEGKRGRAANPEIEKLVAQGLPYWKARALVKKGLASTAAAAPATAETEPEEEPTGDVSVQKTQAAIDDFVSGNPTATIEDVVAHLKGLNAGPLAVKFPYITNVKQVSKMLATATGDKETEEEPAFDPDAEKKAKFAKLRAFMMMPKAKRDEYLARKAKIAKAKRVDKDEEQGEDEPTGKVDMRDEPIDPTEL
jgi:hypothetical protein